MKVIARLKLHRAGHQDGALGMERQVKKLDELLDARFLAAVAPALERAQRARKATSS
jgi:hypothetical protein